MTSFSQKFQKKTSINSSSQQSKPKNKPGAGWEDDDDEPLPSLKSETSQSNNISFNKPMYTFQPISSSQPITKPQVKPINTLEKADDSLNLVLSQRINFSSEFDLLTGEDLNNKNIEYEVKIVEDITQPLGAKVKPPEDMLMEFTKACESLPVQAIGSILIATLSYETNWRTVIKCIYAMEYIAKKLPSYTRYFKYHKDLIENITFNADPNQIKQMQVVHENLLNILRDLPTPKNEVKTLDYADPLMKKYKEQEIKNPIANNLLEDIDPEPMTKLSTPSPDSKKDKEKPSSFRFITDPNKDPIPKVTNLLNTEILSPIKPTKSTQNTYINPQLAAINFNMSLEPQPQAKNNTYIYNPPQPQPQVSNVTKNYSILDSIHSMPMSKPIYNNNYPPVRGFNNTAPIQQTPPMMNPMAYNNNNNPNINLKTSIQAKPKEDPKESAFDFVNELVKMK